MSLTHYSTSWALPPFSQKSETLFFKKKDGLHALLNSQNKRDSPRGRAGAVHWFSRRRWQPRRAEPPGAATLRRATCSAVPQGQEGPCGVRAGGLRRCWRGSAADRAGSRYLCSRRLVASRRRARRGGSVSAAGVVRLRPARACRNCPLDSNRQAQHIMYR